MLVDMIGNRLKELRTAAGMNQPECAAIVGTTKQYVSQLESGKNLMPNGEFLEGWARHFKVNHRWLVSAIGPKHLSSNGHAADDWSDILGVKQPASLGDGSEPEEYAETHKLKFRTDSLARKKLKADKLAVIYGKGDSMHPTIKDGDAILVDLTDKEPRDEKLYVITYGRDLIAKRLIKLGDKWFIDSDNKTDPKWKRPIPVDGAKGFEIHGRVRWIGSWED